MSALLGLATDEDVEAPAIIDIAAEPEWSVESIIVIILIVLVSIFIYAIGVKIKKFKS